MALTDWKRQIVIPNRILWTKGKFKPGYGYDNWIHVDDQTMYKHSSDNFEVGAKQKINPKTINGHFKYFKTKSQALAYAKAYMRKH